MFRIKSFKNIFVSIALPINVKWIKDYKYVFRRMNNNKHIINKLNVFLCLKELLTLFQITLYLKRGIPHSQFGFPFAKLLRNFCERERKFLLLLCYIFARKNSTLHNHSQPWFCAKIRYSAIAFFFLRNFEGKNLIEGLIKGANCIN